MTNYYGSQNKIVYELPRVFQITHTYLLAAIQYNFFVDIDNVVI